MAPNTIVREKIKKKIVQAELLKDLARQVEEQGQVVVHIDYPPQRVPYAIRLWRNTFLISRSSDHRSKLLHAENISMAPVWTEVNGGKAFRFSLFFEGLPKDVLIFDLVEDIPEADGFFFQGIVRNEQDVYWLRG